MAKMGCAKCGGTKKMALGGSAVKKAPVQLYGIPQENMGTSSQMGFGRKGGTLNEMARGGTKKSSSAKIVQQFTRKTLSDKALAARTAGANKANAAKIASKSNFPVKVVKPGSPKVPAKVLTIAQMKALDVAKKASTGSKAAGTGLKVISKVPVKTVVKPVTTTPAPITATTSRTRAGVSKGNVPGVASKYANKPTIKPVLGPDTRNKAIQKNVKRISTKSKDGAKVIAKTLKDGRKMNQTVLLAERFKDAAEKSSGFVNKLKNPVIGRIPKMKFGKKALIGTGITAAAALIGAAITNYKKTTDKPKADIKPKVTPKPKVDNKPVVKKDTKVTPKPVVKPVVSTKTNTNKEGTKTTTYTDAKGIKYVKVVKKDGTTFTSNNKPKPAVVAPPKDTSKTTPVVKKDTKKTETKTPEVKTPETTTTSTTTTPATSTTTSEKVIAKVTPETDKTAVVDRMKNIELSKNPASKKLIESASSNASKTSSAPTTVPRATFINKVRGAINESRERRALRAEERGNNDRATKLRDKEKVTKAKMMMKKGGSVKSFPDLNKDGKITKADILKGRGVIKKKGGVVKTKKK